jgi:hypothetical protein
LTSRLFSVTLNKMDSLNSQVSKNFPYCRKLWMPTILFLVALLSGISGYLIGARTGKSTKSQSVLQPIFRTMSPTPSAVPTVAPTTIFYPQTIDTVVADWKIYTSSDGSYSFQYPPKWLMAEGMLNGGETGVDVNGPEGGFGIVIPPLPFYTCYGGDKQQIQLHGEIIATCHQINPNGSESWGAIVQLPSSTKMFIIQAIAAPPIQNNKALLLQIFSTLTFK